MSKGLYQGEGGGEAPVVLRSEIQNVQALGDRLEMTVTPPDRGAPVRRSRYTLTRLRQGARPAMAACDANLLAHQK
jgi:hypothetical protein